MSEAPIRLRAAAKDSPFRIVLVSPEIPPNTGNIGRICAATCCALHLVEPLAFSIDEKAVRRAGLDYWKLIDVHLHPNFADFQRNLLEEDFSKSRHNPAYIPTNHPKVPRHPDKEIRSPKSWMLSARAKHSYLDVDFQPGDALVFGRESCGLSDELLDEHAENTIGIPTLGMVRSMNIANCVSIVLFEALRQNGLLDSSELR